MESRSAAGVAALNGSQPASSQSEWVQFRSLLAQSQAPRKENGHLKRSDQKNKIQWSGYGVEGPRVAGIWGRGVDEGKG